jgi:SNF2 family DNA or RNA helicase
VVNGQWFVVLPTQVDELAHLCADIGSSILHSITLRQYLALRLCYPEDGIIEPLFNVEDEPASTPQWEPTTELEEQLYQYQRSGVEWLSGLACHGVGGILADEMGLGKTVQLIAFVKRLRDVGRRPTLVVATTSILENWRRELSRFAPDLHVLVHQGTSRTGLPSELRAFDVVIVSYDTLVRDVVLLSQLEWELIIADEAQFLKNPSTQRAASVRRLHATLTVAATGTPVENSLRDLWALVDLVIPGLLGDLLTFSSTFPDEPSAATRLAQVTAPVVLRRRVGDVALELPNRIDIPTPLRFGDEEAIAYESLRESLVGSRRGGGFGALTKLRQFCAHPGLLTGVVSSLEDYSTKYGRLLEILEEIFACGDKVLIFAPFSRMIDILVQDIQRGFQVPAAFIDGRTPSTLRQTTLDQYAACSGAAALVLNPRAAGVGLNITAANHVIHYTPEWNPAVQDQATARAHRLGQRQPVTVHRLFYADSVEEVMEERLLRKRALMTRAVSVPADERADLRDLLAALERSPIRRLVSS